MIVLPGLSTLLLSRGQGVCFAKREHLRVCDREKTRPVLALPLADLLLHPHHRCSWKPWILAVKGVWGVTSIPHSALSTLHTRTASHPHTSRSRQQLFLAALTPISHNTQRGDAADKSQVCALLPVSALAELGHSRSTYTAQQSRAWYFRRAGKPLSTLHSPLPTLTFSKRGGLWLHILCHFLCTLSEILYTWNMLMELFPHFWCWWGYFPDFYVPSVVSLGPQV